LHGIAFQRGDVIGIESLPPHIGSRATASRARSLSSAAPADDGEPLLPLSEARRRVNTTFERAYLLNVLELARGSVSEAARLAGVDRTNLRRLLKRHAIRSDPASRTRR